VGDTSHRTNVVISSNFVAEPLREPLETWIHELQIAATVSFTPYNQVFQQLLDPASSLATNERGLNVILLRLSDWHGSHAKSAEGDLLVPQSELRRNATDFVQAVRQTEPRRSSPTMIITCPDSQTNAPAAAAGQSVQELARRISAELSDLDGVEVITASDLLALYPLADCYDRHADTLAHIPYNSLFYTALGTIIARRLYALNGPIYKVITLDCDGTLWDGLCGEDGPRDVRVDAIRKGLQACMVTQHDRGMLIFLCSRNHEQDVLDVFDCRNDMVLKRTHLAGWKINWKSKSENLQSLSNQLGLSLESFVFIEDDPVVCAEMRAHCPQVLTLLLPNDPQMIPVFLKHIWAFDRTRRSTEDGERTRMYRDHFRRESLRHEVPTLRDFLAGLDLDIRISRLSETEIGRVSQLTHRTNQFNLSGIRQSEREVRQIYENESKECLVVHLKDRFGDYGMVGVAILDTSGDSVVVETFLLSCRALGRGVEHRMMNRIGEIGRERRKSFVDLRCIPTAKNKPAVDFANALLNADRTPNDKGFDVRLAAAEAASLSYDPDIDGGIIKDPSEADASAEPRQVSNFSTSASFVGSIPGTLYTPELIHRWISEKQLRSNSFAGNGSQPISPTEKTIAAIYSELLGVTSVGIHDNFFELGGHSLLAMRALARIHEVFNVELDPMVLFTTNFTVSELGSAVQKEQLRRMNPQDLEGILRKLAEITDEEAQALIPDEPGKTGGSN
jgi:FkbH-like protein